MTNPTDRNILAHLLKSPKGYTPVEIAQAVGITRDYANARLKKLHEGGVVKREMVGDNPAKGYRYFVERLIFA